MTQASRAGGLLGGLMVVASLSVASLLLSCSVSDPAETGSAPAPRPTPNEDAADAAGDDASPSDAGGDRSLRASSAGEAPSAQGSDASGAGRTPGSDAGETFPRPTSAAGRDRVGEPFGLPRAPRLVAGTGPGTIGRRHERPTRAVLYRWWTDTCPSCEASLPAIETLRRTWGPLGLEVIAVYHPKPPRPVDEPEVVAAARRLGYEGDVAIDARWALLDRVWLDDVRRPATSVSFLVDDAGIVRFVHPGPVLFPSDAPEDAVSDADFEALETAIRLLIE